MSLTPFSRENMRALKSQKDEEGHQRKLEQVVRNIYISVVRFAERTTETIYQYRIQNGHYNSVHIPSTIPSNNHLESIPFDINKDYIMGNMDEILARLRLLFPDCSVEYKKVSMAVDIIANHFMDDIKHYIVIDWS